MEDHVVTGSRVAIVGSGYVGTVVAACLAKLGHRVIGVESEQHKLQRLQRGESFFYEPGLSDLLGAGLSGGHLCFTHSTEEAMRASDVVFLCVGTPQAEDGTADMSAVEVAASEVGGSLDRHHVLVTKSTVPIGSGRWLKSTVERSLPAHLRGRKDLCSVVSNPEFLREGSAIEDFLHPSRVVLGSDEPAALEVVAGIYRPVLDQSFSGGDRDQQPALVLTTLATAETIKYASNAFLATKVSFINEMANLCELVGADVSQVAGGIGLDPRIGAQFLEAGIGWGGSCFAKDIGALVATAAERGCELRLLPAVSAVNMQQRRMVVEKLRRHLTRLRGRRVALLGLAFKAGTDDLRDAPSLDIVSLLRAEGTIVSAHDPVVTGDRVPGAHVVADPYDAAEGADAVVLVTDWADYLSLDLEVLRAKMRGDILIDGRNLLDPVAVEKAGLRYEGVGRPNVSCWREADRRQQPEQRAPIRIDQGTWGQGRGESP
ncbi:MAG: UDP-glucose/GDP-mannose dehydrogenase family protein [Actinobacteria bacterium]|nr:UDP-glucose/GDP-mannose dehydrogenase family protein [Actinomycetota bacterium]